MFKEIGSEFWIDSSSDSSNNKIPKWLSMFDNITFTTSGRGAISLLLEQINPIEKKVLMPAYICDSVILPFIEFGYQCFFYDLNENLSPNIDDIFKKENNFGVFLHMGYFGFKTNSNLDTVIKQMKKNSTIIIEDITHSLFSGYKRYKENDFYIGSIRKWFGIPSGGFLASKKYKIKQIKSINEDFTKLRKEALYLKGEYIQWEDEELKEIFLNKFSIAENLLDNDLKPYHIDCLSAQLINKLNNEELFKRRRQNYIYLMENINKNDAIEIIFPDVNNDTCPLVLPVLINKKRNQIKEKLIREKIYCPVHWPPPNQINIHIFESARRLYDSELSIPCDQRYDISDMERIVTIINELS